MYIRKNDSMTATKPKKAATIRPTPWMLRLPEILVSPSTEKVCQIFFLCQVGARKTNLIDVLVYRCRCLS